MPNYKSLNDQFHHPSSNTNANNINEIPFGRGDLENPAGLHSLFLWEIF